MVLPFLLRAPRATLATTYALSFRRISLFVAGMLSLATGDLRGAPDALAPGAEATTSAAAVNNWEAPRPFSKRRGPVLKAPPWIDEASTYPVRLPEGLSEEDGSQRSLTLQQALERAMIANTDVLEAKHTFEAQEGVRMQVRARLLPQVTGISSFDRRTTGGLIDRSPAELRESPDRRLALALSSYDMRIEVRQVVFDGFATWSLMKRQALVKKQSYLTFVNTLNRTASLVRQAYDAVLLRQKGLATEQKRIEGLTQLVAWATRKQLVGEIAEFEQLRADTELQAAKAELAEAKRNLAQSEQVLRRLLQLPDTLDHFQLTDGFVMRDFDLGYHAAVDRAIAARPDLEAAQLQIAADKLYQRAIKAEWFPRFEVVASYGVRSSYYDYTRQLYGWTVGAVGRWNIFDGGENRGRSRAQLAARRIAEARLVEIEHNIVSQLRELYEGLAQTREAIAARRKSLDLALRALGQARRLYEAGQASLEQVLQAELVWRRLENAMNEAVYNYNITVTQIEFAVGTPPEDPGEGTRSWKP